MIRLSLCRLMWMDKSIGSWAVTLRAAYEIHVPDALQVAAAIESGATLFVTNDRRLNKVQEIEILLFDDYLQ